MRGRHALAAAIVIGVVLPCVGAVAGAPETAVIPPPRPAPAAEVPVAPAPAPVAAEVAPEQPAAADGDQPPAAAPIAGEPAAGGLPPIPVQRPVRQAELPPPVVAPLPEQVICQDPRLIGKIRGNIVGPIPGCGIHAPVQVTEIAGVRMEGEVTLDCRTARTLANWLTGVAQPEARRRLGARISKLWVIGTYSCRTRNNRPGARLSEHAAGRAVDVAGFILGNGRRITVLQNWGKGVPGEFLRHVWTKACGPFTTVLGPQSDRWHKDHLHLDTAYRDNTFCR